VPTAPGSNDGPDVVAPALVELEARLLRGDLVGAIDEMSALALRHPGEARVRVRLARLLHQRALLRYGEGDVNGAIDDWRHVLRLDPNNAAVKVHLRRATNEAARER
jgi:hypothetical protein